MTDIHDLNKNAPAKAPTESRTKGDEAEQAHRRVEQEAMNMAKRAEDRQKKDPDEFSNIAPA